MPSKNKNKQQAHPSSERATVGVKRAASPGESGSSKRVKVDKGTQVTKTPPSTRGSLRRSTRYKDSLCGHDRQRHGSVDAQDGSAGTDDGEVFTQSAIRRMFIDDEAMEAAWDNEYEATEPEEDDGGAYEPIPTTRTNSGNRRGNARSVKPTQTSGGDSSSPRLCSSEKRAPAKTPGDSSGFVGSSDEPALGVSASRSTRCSGAPDAAGISDVGALTTSGASGPPKSRVEVGVVKQTDAVPDVETDEMDAATRLKPALSSLLMLLKETPDLVKMLSAMEELASTKPTPAVPTAVVSAPKIAAHGSAQPVESGPADSQSKGSTESAPADAQSKGTTESAVAVAVAAPSSVPAEPDDSKFNGTKNCLDHDLWAPVLRSMYRKLKPPPRIVRYFTRGNPSGIQAASFAKWSKHERLGFMKDMLGMACTNQYVNISRMPFRNMRVETGGSVSYPLNYLTRRGTAEPALFVSLVEVKKCSLLAPDRIKRRDGTGFLEKKGIIANLLQQEFELMICNLGCIYNVDTITLPSWSTKAEDRGLTFHTKVTACHEEDTIHASPSKPGLFDPRPTSSKTRFPVQLVGAHRVPLFDSSVDGFDIHQPFADLKELPDMQEEAAPGSMGVVFYTISDSGGPSRIEFNIHGFALVAEPQLDWSDSD